MERSGQPARPAQPGGTFRRLHALRRSYPPISFFGGMLALYGCRFLLPDTFRNLPHVFAPFVWMLPILLSAVVAVAGVVAVLTGVASLRGGAWRTPHGVAAQVGISCGLMASIYSVLHGSFLLYVLPR